MPPSAAPKGSSSSSARRSAPEAAYQAFDGGAASALYTGFQPSPEGTGKANGMEGHKAAGPMSSAKAPHRPAASGSASVQQASEFTSELVQNLAAGSGKPKKKKKIGDIKKIAKKGVKGGAKKLPHAAKIKKSFGKYGPDVDNIQAHIGGRAGEAAQELKAEAYAFGSHIAFTERPTIEIAAHEAAHAVGQMYGEGPPGGVGKPGDRWEKSADRIARKAKSGQDAEAEIEKMLGNKAAAGPKESAQGLGGFAESLQLHATAAAGDFPRQGVLRAGERLVNPRIGDVHGARVRGVHAASKRPRHPGDDGSLGGGGGPRAHVGRRADRPERSRRSRRSARAPSRDRRHAPARRCPCSGPSPGRRPEPRRGRRGAGPGLQGQPRRRGYGHRPRQHRPRSRPAGEPRGQLGPRSGRRTGRRYADRG